MTARVPFLHDAIELLPVSQQGNGELTFYEQFSRAFSRGLAPGPVYAWILGLLIMLVAVYWLLRLLSYLSHTSETTQKQYSILESIESNLKLSDRQQRYLKALIEKFKDRSTYEPEVSTEYLRDFLFFSIQNLAHAPKRSIRRKTHYVPEFKADHNVDVMVQLDDETYTTLQTDVLDQDEEKVRLTIPSDASRSDELRQGLMVNLAYKKGDLTLRGEAEIVSRDNRVLTLDLHRGMHFEEKRTYDRVEVEQIPCQLILQEWEGQTLRYEGFLNDLSVGGARVVLPDSDTRIDHNMRGRVQFEVNSSDELDLEVMVIHSEMNEPPYTVGLEFLDPGMVNRNNIHNYIQKRQSREE